MAKRQTLYRIVAESGVVNLYVNGKVDMSINPANLPVETREYAALHGIKQKCGDAGADDDKVPVETKLEYVREMFRHLAGGGDWNQRGGGGGGVDLRILTMACEAAFIGQPIADDPDGNLHTEATVAARIKSWDSNTRRAILNGKNALTPYIEQARAKLAASVPAEVVDATLAKF